MTIEQERLERLMARLDKSTAEAFALYVTTVRSDAFIKEVAALIESNQIEVAINLVDSHIRKMAAVIPRNFNMVGQAAVTALEGTVTPSVAITFDPAYPRAAQTAQRQMYDLIQRITDEQKTSIRNALSESFMEGTNPREAARAFRSAVGLTDRQREAVKNYRRLLETGSKEAFNRGLRDARFGPKDVANQQKYLDNLTPEQIDRMVAAYEKRYLAYRAETIARTESTRTLAEANDEGFRQVLEQAEIPDNQVERKWRSTNDARTRDTHRNMTVRVVVGMDTPFVTGGGVSIMRPGDPSAPKKEVINCRCVVTNRIMRAEEVS